MLKIYNSLDKPVTIQWLFCVAIFLLLTGCFSSSPADEEIQKQVTEKVITTNNDTLTNNFMFAPYALKSELQNFVVLGKQQSSDDKYRVKVKYDIRIIATQKTEDWKSVAKGLSSLAVLGSFMSEEAPSKNSYSFLNGEWVSINQEYTFSKWDKGWLIED